MLNQTEVCVHSYSLPHLGLLKLECPRRMTGIFIYISSMPLLVPQVMGRKECIGTVHIIHYGTQPIHCKTDKLHPHRIIHTSKLLYMLGLVWFSKFQ